MVYACINDFDIETINDELEDDICIGFLCDTDTKEVIEECEKRNIAYDIFEYANVMDVTVDEKTGFKTCEIHFALLKE